MTSGCSGFPKFKQFVAAKGRPPEHTMLRHASATAIFAPSRGCRATRYPGPSKVIASAFFVPLTLTTAASEPGPTIVFDCTMWSYCCHTHCRDERFGEETASVNSLFQSSVSDRNVSMKEVSQPSRNVKSSRREDIVDFGGSSGRWYTGASSASA